jgi:hypothetical protein
MKIYFGSLTRLKSGDGLEYAAAGTRRPNEKVARDGIAEQSGRGIMQAA